MRSMEVERMCGELERQLLVRRAARLARLHGGTLPPSASLTGAESQAVRPGRRSGRFLPVFSRLGLLRAVLGRRLVARDGA